MANYISNAFSLNMLNSAIEEEELRVDKRNGDFPNQRPINPMVYPVIAEILPQDIPHDCISGVGHSDTACILSKILKFNVPQNRMSIDLKKDDHLYVAQYFGPRLPEGCTELPDGAHFKYFEIHIGETWAADMCPGGVAVS